MTAWEFGLGAACCVLAGMLAGALWELKRVHRVCMRAWMFQASAQDQAARLRHDLAEAQRQLGALQAARGEVLEAAIGAAKLAQLDALRPADSPHTPHTF
ncbi:MAG: hypothetical protein IPM99_18880 [Rubrivivax sp.]|nr:hypothetical protein [Rubrivivax sp.]